MTTSEALAVVIQALAVLFGSCISAVVAWRRWVWPVLKAILHHAEGANTAVNNVPAGTPTLVARVEALETGQASLLAFEVTASEHRAEMTRSLGSLSEDMALIKAIITKGDKL